MPLSPLLAAASTVEVGGYVSIWKSVVLVIITLIWARMLTWADKDAEAAFMPRVPINIGMVAGLALGLALFFILPGFLIALPVLIVLMAIEISVYLTLRNQKVGLKDLGVQFREWLASFKPKEKRDANANKGDTIITNKGGAAILPPDSDAPPLDKAGYEAMQLIFTDPLRKGASRIEILSGEQRSSSKYFVDGMGYDGAPVNKADVSKAIELLKDSMGLDVSDRRKPQIGMLRGTVDKKKHEMRLITAGSTAGESLVVDIDMKKNFELKLDALGFMPEQMPAIQDMITDTSGVVLLCTPKGQGLTSLEYAILRAHDAFLTHIQTIERMPEIELEGITQNSLPHQTSAGEELKQVGWVVSQEPEVIMISKVEDPKSAIELIKHAAKGKRTFIGMRANSTFEAIEQWRKLVGDDKLAMKNLKMVICGRVIRKLCEACKIDYSPDPATLRKLGMSPDKVNKLFTARTTPLKDAKGNTVVCEFCLDLRFKGRVGLYEILMVDDEVREIVQQGGSINQLKMAFKKQKGRYLQEQALARAVSGDTSLQEVARVLKGDGGTSSTAAKPSSGGGGGGARPPSSGQRPSSGPSSGPRPPSSTPKRSAPQGS